jgi:RimJ/RimL family protein N-acetyltransferase
MQFIVAENEKKELVGFASGSITSIPKTRAPKIGILISVFVKKEYRGKEIGKQFFKAMLQWFKSKKVKYIETSVDAQNKNSVKLWKKFGFHDYQLRLKMDL